jgi:hypothetical protein
MATNLSRDAREASTQVTSPPSYGWPRVIDTSSSAITSAHVAFSCPVINFLFLTCDTGRLTFRRRGRPAWRKSVFIRAVARSSTTKTSHVSTIQAHRCSTRARKVSDAPRTRPASCGREERSTLAHSVSSIGWKCCKPRVLTFDEFLEIPPCTTGKHSTVDDTPAPAPAAAAPPEPATSLPAAPRIPTATSTAQAPATPPPAVTPQPESESDEPGVPVPAGAECRRKGCSAKFGGDESRQGEVCRHHPGAPVFHEGSKGYSCCKRRVLEFDEFMRIEGCKEKPRHLFLAKAKKAGETGAGGKEKVESVR